MVCRSQRFRAPFREAAITSIRLLPVFLARRDIYLVSFAEARKLELRGITKNVLDFVRELQDCLVGSIELTSNLSSLLLFHFSDNMESLRDREVMVCEDRYSDIVENTPAGPAFVALCALLVVPV